MHSRLKTVPLYGFTLLWLAGYAEFHLHFLGHPTSSSRTAGASILAALGLYIFALFVSGFDIRETFRALAREFREGPFLFKALAAAVLLLFLVGAAQSAYPPHLSQESDVLNYHMTLPRQHLLRESLAWIPWSAADLWPMPVQFGLAPAWFISSHLHKIPQFLAAVNLFVLLLLLGRRFDSTLSWRGWVPALAFFTTHGVMIQLGTAMIDIVILYFLFAAYLGFIERSPLSFGLHLAVFLTAKAFSPIHGAAVLAMVLFLKTISRRNEHLVIPRGFLLKSAGLCAVAAALLLSRSAMLGWAHAGTVLHPFFLSDSAPPALLESARAHLATRDAYGVGRGLWAFLRHFWFIAVPTKGVNNEYDYPLGLAWLLLLALAAFALPARYGRRRDPHVESNRVFRTDFAAVLAVSFWAVWWIGSHQSRWLFPALAFGWLATLDEQRKIAPRVLLACLCASAGFSILSQLRAYRFTFHHSPALIQRTEEGKVRAGEISKGVLSHKDALFYSEPILRIDPPDGMWIIPVSSLYDGEKNSEH